MIDSWTEYRKNVNLYPLSIPNKVKYYNDILNIEQSFTGRMDAESITNTFIMEAAQLLINSICLFEMGYFDCAYYSLRSAVDVSTTMVYLVDIPDEEREVKLSAWKETKAFPTQGRIVKELSVNGNFYRDMLDKMHDFFSEAKTLAEKLNKYVHKQGLQHYYISRNHPLNQSKSREVFINNFEEYLKKCIGIVAVMRLAIDPFPVLLMDKDILYRCYDSMTDPYSEEFASEYIGKETIEAYKSTDMYACAYDSFIKDEEKSEATFDVMKHHYINTARKDEIISQFHLLYLHDIICSTIAFTCDKAVKIYALGGLLMYFTDRNTKRTATHWSGKEFNDFATNTSSYNQRFDEAYISVFPFRNDNYFVEHNEVLDDYEIDKINYELESLDAVLPIQ